MAGKPPTPSTVSPSQPLFVKISSNPNPRDTLPPPWAISLPLPRPTWSPALPPQLQLLPHTPVHSALFCFDSGSPDLCGSGWCPEWFCPALILICMLAFTHSPPSLAAPALAFWAVLELQVSDFFKIGVVANSARFHNLVASVQANRHSWSLIPFLQQIFSGKGCFTPSKFQVVHALLAGSGVICKKGQIPTKVTWQHPQSLIPGPLQVRKSLTGDG